MGQSCFLGYRRQKNLSPTDHTVYENLYRFDLFYNARQTKRTMHDISANFRWQDYLTEYIKKSYGEKCILETRNGPCSCENNLLQEQTKSDDISVMTSTR